MTGRGYPDPEDTPTRPVQRVSDLDWVKHKMSILERLDRYDDRLGNLEAGQAEIVKTMHNIDRRLVAIETRAGLAGALAGAAASAVVAYLMRGDGPESAILAALSLLV